MYDAPPLFSRVPKKLTSTSSPFSLSAAAQSFSTAIPHTGNAPNTKSFSWAVCEEDERVSARKAAKPGVLPNSLVTLIPPSKKLSWGSVVARPLFGVYSHSGAFGRSTTLVMAQASLSPCPLHLALVCWITRSSGLDRFFGGFACSLGSKFLSPSASFGSHW